MNAMKKMVMGLVLVVMLVLSSGCSDSTANRSAVGSQFTAQGNALTGTMNAAWDLVH